MTNGSTGHTTSDGFYMGYWQDGHLYCFNQFGHIIVGTNGTDRLRIESGGNVGIGTDNPGALLQLRKDAAGSLPLLQLSSHAGAAGGFTDNYCVEFRHASSGVTHGMLVSNNEAVPLMQEEL